MPGPGMSAPEQGGVQEILGMLAPEFGTWGPAIAAQGPFVGAGGGGGPGGGGGYPGGGMSIPPELAQYFNADMTPRLDDPRQVAAEGGITAGALAGGFFPRHREGSALQGYDVPSDKGGFFSLSSLFGLTGTPALVPNMGPQRPGGTRANVHPERVGMQEVPRVGAWGQDAPSTNNWRLLGSDPYTIMRNGFRIHTKSGSLQDGYWAGGAAGGGNSGEQAVQGLGRIALGTGAGYGVPNLYANGGNPAFAGWPGAESWIPVFPGNV